MDVENTQLDVLRKEMAVKWIACIAILLLSIRLWLPDPAERNPGWFQVTVWCVAASAWQSLSRPLSNSYGVFSGGAAPRFHSATIIMST